MNTKSYAGIGSRSTPIDILFGMRKYASLLEKNGYTLNSGGAQGADTAFFDGVTDAMKTQIFTPWPS